MNAPNGSGGGTFHRISSGAHSKAQQSYSGHMHQNNSGGAGHQYVGGGGGPMASSTQRMGGPSGHGDGRVTKKMAGGASSGTGNFTKHKIHGMNQSMDAGAGTTDLYQMVGSGSGLGNSFGGVRPNRGDRQSLLGPGGPGPGAGAAGQVMSYQQQQHQNYVNISHDTVQRQTMSMTNDAHGFINSPDYHHGHNQMNPSQQSGSHLIQTMATTNPSGKQPRPKNQSIDVTGSHPGQFQQIVQQPLKGGIMAGGPHGRHMGMEGFHQEQMSSHLTPSTSGLSHQGAHFTNQVIPQQQNRQQVSQSAMDTQQEYQRKKRRQNLSQNLQKREQDQNVMGGRGEAAGAAGPMGQSHHMQSKAGKNATKSMHQGQMAAIQSQGQFEYHNRQVNGGNNNLRANSKYEDLGSLNPGNPGNYSTLGNLHGLPEGITSGSFDQVAPQILQSQQNLSYAHGYHSQAQGPAVSKGAAPNIDQQKYNTALQGSNYVTQQKSSGKLKNKSSGGLMISNMQSGHGGAGHTKGSHSQDRFQSTQVVGTKKGHKGSASTAKGGSIIIPANSTVQIVPQLRHQMVSGGQPSKSQSKSGGGGVNDSKKGYVAQSHHHHRMYSEDSPNMMMAPNMQKGFNSASNAALQQQQVLISQIYQPNGGQVQSGAYHSTLSANKMKYSTGAQGTQSNNNLANSRKFISMGGANGLHQSQNQMITGMVNQQQQSQLNIRNAAKSNQNSKERDQHPHQMHGTTSHSQSQQFVTQPNSNKLATNQISLQMQKKLQQQSDTSRVNRLQQVAARGVGDINSQGVYLPKNDTNTISYIKIDYNTQNSSGAYNQHNKSSHSRDKFSIQGQHHQIPSNSKKDTMLQHQYKMQMAHTKQQSAQNTFYPKAESSQGLSGVQDQHMKYSQQQSIIIPSSKHGGGSALANNHSGMLGGNGANVGHSANSYKSQSHIRQASLQIGPGGAAVGDMTSSTQKMAANHRKNKSMMSNPGRISSNIQKQQQRLLVQDHHLQKNHQQHASQALVDHSQTAMKLQVSYIDKDGYHQINHRGLPSQSQTNFYQQFADQHHDRSTTLVDSNQMSSQATFNKKTSQMKSHLSQSSHRKNKTTMIGNSPQKMLGVQSTSGFQRIPSGLHDKQDKMKLLSGQDSHHPIPTKKAGATLSYSHKSLHSNSSHHRRGYSVEPPSAGISQYHHPHHAPNDTDHHPDGSLFRHNTGNNQIPFRDQSHHQLAGGSSTAAVRASGSAMVMQKGSGGKVSPGLVSPGDPGSQLGERRTSIHGQKAQKFLKDQANFVSKQRLKPQGNIVIQQQETSQRSGQNNMHRMDNSYTTKIHKNQAVPLKASAQQRRQPSYLKGELQNQNTVLISEQDYRSHVVQDQSQQHHSGISQKKIGRSQSPHLQKFGKHVNPDGTQMIEQDSVGSLSSQKAITILDGGTGGGNSKNDGSQNKSSAMLHKGHERHNSALTGGGYTPGGIDNSYIDKNTVSKFKNSNQRGKVIDSSQIHKEMSHQNNISYKQKGNSLREKSDARSSAHGNNNLGQDQDNLSIDLMDVSVPQARDIRDNKKHLQTEKAYVTGKDKYNSQSDLIQNSINITQEALEIGKVPIEKIAQLIATNQLTQQSATSPRTKEIIEMSNLIKKNFKQKNEAPKTSASFYRAGKMLGRGAFGKVCLGMHKLSRKLVALKSINKEFMTDAKQKSKVMHEVGILLRLRHESVVQLYETFETKRHMILSMELCAGGDLLNYVRKRKKLEESEAKVLFKQIIQGLGYIHKRRILHRDIKLDNILLDGTGRVKIADFGVSKLVQPGDLMHEQSGTPAYIAPEILKEEGYRGFKADIWSAGVVFYAMLCGTVPFKASNMKELHKMIIKGKYHLKEEVTPEAKHLLRQMLETDPVKRISIKKILSHPWFDNLDPQLEIFSPEEKQIVKKEFVYNNPKVNNRSEKVDLNVEPWDCFTELNLDSVNQTLRNESEKSVILAPFNSSFSDFDEEQFKGMEASLIIHRHFEDQAPLEDKKQIIRFAARCRDQDRQYEINNNGELDNGVYHKFVYSSREGQPRESDSKSSFNDLRPHSSRNLKGMSGQKGTQKFFGKENTQTESDIEGISSDANKLMGVDEDQVLDESRMQCLANLGYPPGYIRKCLQNGDASYCLAAYFLLGDSQIYG